MRRRAATDELTRVRRAQAGDPRAFEALIAEHDRALRGLAFGMLGDRMAMQDVMQEAYVGAYRAIGSFRGDAAVGSWLHRIVFNACIDELRRRPVRAHAPLDAIDDVDPAPGLAESLVARGDLSAALATLSAEHRAIVLLVDGEGFSYDEVADLLGIPAGTVASRLHRARAVLRPTLKPTTTERGS